MTDIAVFLSTLEQNFKGRTIDNFRQPKVGSLMITMSDGSSITCTAVDVAAGGHGGELIVKTTVEKQI